MKKLAAIIVVAGAAILAAPLAASAAPPPSAAPPTLPPGFVTLVDDTGVITVAVPQTWTDVDTRPVTDGSGNELPAIAASPNIETFIDTFDVPGIQYIRFPFTPDPQTLINSQGLSGGCQSITVQPYSDGAFTGVAQVGTSCGATGQASWLMVVASPENQSMTAVVQLQGTGPADQQAIDVGLASFNVVTTGAVPATASPLPTVSPTPPTAPVSTASPLPTTASPLPTVSPLPPTVAPPPTVAAVATTSPLPTLVPSPTFATTAPVSTAPAVPTVAPGSSLVPATPPSTGAPIATTSLVDDTRRITVDVPATWTQANTAPAVNGNPSIVASTDLTAFNSEDPATALTVPGLRYMAGPYMADTQASLQFLGGGVGAGCVPSDVEPYDDGIFVGHFQAFGQCNGTNTLRVVIVANPQSNDLTASVVIQLASRDDPALDVILDTFNLVG